MDYQKMWFSMKEHLLRDEEIARESRRRGVNPGELEKANKYLNLMSDIEVKAMKEGMRMVGCGSCCDHGEPEPPKGIVGKQDPHKNSESGKNRETESPDDGKDILRDIFGKRYVSDLETLEKRIRDAKEPVIMVDGDLDIPESLQKEAREKKIAIAKARCGVINAENIREILPFPYPFHLEIMKEFGNGKK